jgi:hypothetical protein
MWPGYRIRGRRSGGRLLDRRRYGYSGGQRPGFRDAFRCPRLRFGFLGRHWLGRQAVDRFSSWRRQERLLGMWILGGRRFGGRRFGGRRFGGRRFGYSGGQRPGFRDFFRCPRLPFRFCGGRLVVDRFGSWRRLGRLLIGRSSGRLRGGIGGRISGRRGRRRCLVDPVRLQP